MGKKQEKKNKKHVVKMNVLRKEPTLTSEDSQQTSEALKVQEISVLVGDDEDNSLTSDCTPGAKQRKLKEKLQAEMARKRRELRAKKEEDKKMEEEEEEQMRDDDQWDGEEENAEEEDPEAELTDQTDTDEEEEVDEDNEERLMKKL